MRPTNQSRTRSQTHRNSSIRSTPRQQGTDLGETDTTSDSDEDLDSDKENRHRVTEAQTSRIVPKRRVKKKPVKNTRDIQFRNFIQNYKKLAESVNFMIPRAAFARVVREILTTFDTDVKFVTPTAFEALQSATEAYVEARLEDANLLALHARRVTLMVRDLELINFLRSNGL